MLEAEAERREEWAVRSGVIRQVRAQYEKAIESERYFDALRTQLRAEASLRSKPLPALCACGLDPLEDNFTQNCARNCIFFNNPQAYGRALSGLFVRPIVLD